MLMPLALAITPPVDYSQQQDSGAVNVVKGSIGSAQPVISAGTANATASNNNNNYIASNGVPIPSGCWLGKYSDTKYLRSLCSVSGFWNDFASVFQKWVGFSIIFAILVIILAYWLFGKIFNRG